MIAGYINLTNNLRTQTETRVHPLFSNKGLLAIRPWILIAVVTFDTVFLDDVLPSEEDGAGDLPVQVEVHSLLLQ